MKTVCPPEQCTGCMLCADSCPKQAIALLDGLDRFSAEIDPALCVDCGICYQHCQRLHPPVLAAPIRWAQGWAADPDLRQKASSGGVAAAISRAFAEKGGVVCSCLFRDGAFQFDLARSASETAQFTGSKYVKSDPSGVYHPLQALLRQGERVLFIGLPCQVGALKALVGDPDNLYTIDLICHGTPSPLVLELFLEQYHRPLDTLKDVSFRIKAKMQVHGDGIGLVPKGVSDKYTIAFLNSLSYTENCYSCGYARRERVSDLTLGDSWGSDLPMEEQKKGVSLLLCQSAKGQQLLEQADLTLFPVDAEQAIAHNRQLHQPSMPHKKRSAFFNGLREGVPFNRLVFSALPKQCLKQDAKELLLRLGLLNSESGK